MASLPHSWITLEQYLDLEPENRSQTRHEYFAGSAGEIFEIEAARVTVMVLDERRVPVDCGVFR